MGSVEIHDNKRDEVLGKIELSAAKNEKAKKQRAADRAAKDAKRAKQRKEFVGQVYDLVEQRSSRR